MAKVEQFPDKSGQNTMTEDIKSRKTREMPDLRADRIRAPSDAARETADRYMQDGTQEASGRRMPDDSLLMGSSSPGPASTGPGSGSAETDKDVADKAGEKKGTVMSFSRFLRREDGRQGLSYEQQIINHRKKVRAARFFAAVIAVMAVLLIVLFFTTRRYNRAELTKIRDFVAEEGSVCVNFDGRVLQYGPNGATCADRNGRVKWSITYEMDQPIVSMRGSVAAIADYGGTTIYVMNEKKQLYTVSTSMPIHKVSVSEGGGVAAVLDDKSRTWIRLYSNKGKEIAYFIRSMEENGYPMDVALSPDGEKVCVSSLLMKDDSVVSNLSFYNFGKEGRDYDQHMVGYFEYTNEVFPYVRFMGNRACAAASDSRLVVFDTSSAVPKNSINNMLTENLQGIFESGNRIGLLFTDLTRENLYRLDLFGRDGKKEGSVGFSMVFDELQIKGGKVYINNEQSMQIYSTSGRQIFSGGFDRPVKVLIPGTTLGDLAAVAENEIDSIRLR